MAQLTLTWFSGIFAGVAITVDNPQTAFHAGLVAGFFYLLAWVMASVGDVK
jgi:hypothetical protein